MFKSFSPVSPEGFNMDGQDGQDELGRSGSEVTAVRGMAFSVRWQDVEFQIQPACCSKNHIDVTVKSAG